MLAEWVDFWSFSLWPHVPCPFLRGLLTHLYPLSSPFPLSPYPFPLSPFPSTLTFFLPPVSQGTGADDTQEKSLLKVAQRPQQKMVLGSAVVWAAERSHTRNRSGVTLLSLTSSLINQQNLWHDEGPKNDLESALRDNRCRFWMTQNLSSGLLLCLPFH